MSEHTPSPQSVVVPVEPTPEMLNAAVDATAAGSGMSWSNRSPQSLFEVGFRAMLAAAPAPSSLAGGEVLEAAKRLGADLDEGRIKDLAVSRDVATILAALSPEAPAREGEESFDNVEARAEAWSDRAEIQRMVEATTGVFAKWSSHEILSRFRQQFMAVIQQAYIEGYDAALTPRHEAPADHHEQNLTASNAELIEQALSHPPLEAPAEGAGEFARQMEILRKAASVPVPDDDSDFTVEKARRSSESWRVIAANVLREYDRARSSAPEAREGEAPVRGEIRVINGVRCRFIERELEGDKWEVIGPAHPAAPSADKLRIAVEALEAIQVKAKVMRNAHKLTGPSAFEGDHRARKVWADDRYGEGREIMKLITPALAALKAEGAK